MTLVFGARDVAHSHALALRDYLEGAARETGEYASPPCFMHELDPGWVDATPEPTGNKPRR